MTSAAVTASGVAGRPAARARAGLRCWVDRSGRTSGNTGGRSPGGTGTISTSVPATRAQVSMSPPSVVGSSGPTAWNAPGRASTSNCTTRRARSRESMICTGCPGSAGSATRPPRAARRTQYVKAPCGSCGPATLPGRTTVARAPYRATTSSSQATLSGP